MRQRGWVSPTSIMGILIAVLGFMLWAQTQRLDIAQGHLDLCRENVDKWAKSVRDQNKAVDELEKDSAKRARNAAAALAKARQGQGKADSEIARLRSINAAALDCAGAVEQVKRGMR